MMLAKRRRTRRVILDHVSRRFLVDPSHRRVMRRNGGGDALDAVLAAVGVERAWREVDHARIARHPRYSREGHLYY